MAFLNVLLCFSNYYLFLQDRYLFCSGAYDGKVNLYSALRMELLMCYQITTMTLARNVNAVRFTSDGSRVCDFRLQNQCSYCFCYIYTTNYEAYGIGIEFSSFGRIKEDFRMV